MGGEQSGIASSSINQSRVAAPVPQKNPHEPLPEYAVKVQRMAELYSPAKRALTNHPEISKKFKQNSHFPIYEMQQVKAYYQGEWRDHLPNGKGNLLYDGYYYCGDFQDGHAQTSKGYIIYPNGVIYEGEVGRQSNSEYQKSTVNGKGKIISLNNQFTYIGNFKNGKPNGNGVEEYSDGTRYEGQFLDGEKHGKGIYTWDNGKMKYEGEFIKGLMSGKGFLKNNDLKQEYQGIFVNGKKHGYGSLKNQYGTYQGTFTNDMLNGEGKFTWNDKKVYIGNFKDTKMHGKGKIQYPNKQVVEGQWENDHNVALSAVHNNQVSRSRVPA